MSSKTGYLVADSIAVIRQKKLLLSDFSARFSPASLTLLLGANGSGKSLVLSALSGLIKPQRGKVYFEDQGKKSKQLPVAMTLQNAANQVLGQTVADEVMTTIAGHRGHRTRSIEGEALDILEASHLVHLAQRDPFTLSGGELRRTVMASLQGLNPRFILMDEPFSDLDYPGVVQLLTSILKMKKAGISFVIVTHHLDQIAAHADRFILLKEGKTIADGLPERVLPFLAEHGVRKPSLPLKDMSWL